MEKRNTYNETVSCLQNELLRKESDALRTAKKFGLIISNDFRNDFTKSGDLFCLPVRFREIDMSYISCKSSERVGKYIKNIIIDECKIDEDRLTEDVITDLTESGTYETSLMQATRELIAKDLDLPKERPKYEPEEW
jgi:hypothetical protein